MFGKKYQEHEEDDEDEEEQELKKKQKHAISRNIMYDFENPEIITNQEVQKIPVISRPTKHTIRRTSLPNIKQEVIPFYIFKGKGTQNDDEIFAEITLNTEYIVIHLINIVDDTFNKLSDGLFIELLNKYTNYFNNANSRKKNTQRKKINGGSNSITRKFFPIKKNMSHSIKFNGGLGEEECLSKLKWGLEYGIPDTLHDFGGYKRNGIFPRDSGKKTGVEFSRAVLNKAKEFLVANYSPTPIDLNAITDTTIFTEKDGLYPIYKEHPANFEDEVKTKYLLGGLCGDLHNVSYFFNEQQPTNWDDMKKEYFTSNKPSDVDDAFFQILGNYDYFILDACMSIHKEERFNKPKLITLSNLWDPVGAGFTELIYDGDNELGLELIPETILDPTFNKSYPNYTIYNSIKQGGNIPLSFYDETYNELLNKFCLNDDDIGIKFYLRLAKHYDKKDKIDKYYVAILIKYNNNEQKVFVLSNGGFSVKTLSFGLRYIEKNFQDLQVEDIIENEKDEKKKLKKMNDEFKELREIINFVKSILESKIRDSDKNEKIKRLLYVLLTRFKSSGDHGTAMATKFINEKLNKPTIYLTGDQLAYVYSIANQIPTLFRFFGGKGDHDDDDEKTCKVERSHFLGFYSGNIKEDKILQERYNKIYDFFKDFFKNSLTSTETNIEDLNNDISELNDILKQQITNVLELTQKPNPATELNIKNIEDKKAIVKQTIESISPNILIDINRFSRLTTPIVEEETKERLKPIYKYLHSISKLRGYIFIYTKINVYKNLIIDMLTSHLNTYKTTLVTLPNTKMIGLENKSVTNNQYNKSNELQKRNIPATDIMPEIHKIDGLDVFGDSDIKNIQTYDDFVKYLAGGDYGQTRRKNVTTLTKIIEIKTSVDKKINDLLNDKTINLPICKLTLNEIITTIIQQYYDNLIEITEQRLDNAKNNRYKYVKDFFIKIIFNDDTSRLKTVNDEYTKKEPPAILKKNPVQENNTSPPPPPTLNKRKRESEIATLNKRKRESENPANNRTTKRKRDSEKSSPLKKRISKRNFKLSNIPTNVPSQLSVSSSRTSNIPSIHQ